MHALTRQISVSLSSCILALGLIFGFVGFGLDLRFAHIFGYALGILFYLSLAPVGVRQVGREQFQITLAVFAVSCAFSLLSLCWIQSRRPLNPYVIEIVASLVFAVALGGLNKIIGKVSGSQLFSNAWLKRIARGRLIPAAFAVCLGIVSIVAFISFYDSIDARATLNVGSRVQPWIDAAECFAKTGKILVLCLDSGRFLPIETANVADDRGHTLILSLSHGWFGLNATKRSLILINYIIVVASLALLSLFVARNGRPIAACLLVLSGPIIAASPFVTADSTGTYYGMFALALLMPLQLLRMLRLDPMPNAEWFWFMISAICLVFVALIRQPFGMMGEVAALVFLLVGLAIRGRRLYLHSSMVIMATIFSVFVAMNATQIAFSFRANVQGIPQEEGTITHGIVHSLYIGLGAEKNSFGIEYSDLYGELAVKKVDPNIPFASNKYFDVLFHLYIQIIREHPAEVAQIYATKFGKAFGPIVLPVLLLLLASILLGNALTPVSNLTGEMPALLIVLPIVLLAVLNTVQGVLTTPSGNNFSIVVGFVALLAVAADVWFQIIWGQVGQAGRGKVELDAMAHP